MSEGVRAAAEVDLTQCYFTCPELPAFNFSLVPECGAPVQRFLRGLC